MTRQPAFDPLSSQGVTWALESGLIAARRLMAVSKETGERFPAYAFKLSWKFIHYLDMRVNYYGVSVAGLILPSGAAGMHHGARVFCSPDEIWRKIWEIAKGNSFSCISSL